ncbi:TetR/AcrR family transcriptional regulator [Sphingobium sufflavum]|uniref:TetR/AcrR family transcriptional regulator n=1 Tax=Sphingobium sufflavum TaxID=1129547 RepID=UPI001F34613D|nr:TetR/AcrR family transcriptional regulator [Sphingobium sufflavum]MCE7796713.1 TetR/AcrR family transcriptional regulator [Sphingobium sufflavum]
MMLASEGAVKAASSQHFTLHRLDVRSSEQGGESMTKVQSTTKRRMAQPGSANWLAMLDSAEAILREEGYGALSSRAVADRIGVKQRLVYYYFETMDDLIVATFRRLSERELQRLAEAMETDQPAREIWDLCVHTSDARLISEFMALANRNQALRGEVITFIEASREMQMKVLSKAAAKSGMGGALPPAVIALLATSLALSMKREAELGVTTGHDDAKAVVENFLLQTEKRP